MLRGVAIQNVFRKNNTCWQEHIPLDPFVLACYAATNSLLEFLNRRWFGGAACENKGHFGQSKGMCGLRGGAGATSIASNPLLSLLVTEAGVLPSARSYCCARVWL